MLQAGLLGHALAQTVQVTPVGQWPGFERGRALAVAVSGSYAYVAAESGGLIVIDVSNPANPVRVGGWDTPGWAYGVAVVGHYAFVADHVGLQVVDVSDPANPVRVGGHDTPNDAYPRWGAIRVAVSGKHAYVVCRVDVELGLPLAGLQVIDVSNPANPVLVGRTHNIPRDSNGVAVADHYAYVAGDTAGLQVMDVSDPAEPVRVGGYDTPGRALDVAVADNYAFVADYVGLQVIDVSNPAKPVRVGGCDTPGDAYGVAVTGNHAYVADYHAGLQVIDVSDPANPVRVGSFDSAGWAQGVAVAGDYAFVADGGAGLQVSDVSNPANPVRVGSFDSAGWAQGVAVAGNYAYVADWEAGMRVIDVSNPEKPTEMGRHDTPGWAEDVAVAGNYAYVADDWAGLHVIDVSNPAHPVRVGGYDTPGRALGVAVAGNYAYVADWEPSLQVIDVSDPAQPVRVGGTESPLWAWALGVAVARNHAYVADWKAGLQVIDVSNPEKPTAMGRHDTPTRAYGVAVAGNHAYVADERAGLQVMDVSNPVRPVRVGSFDTAGWAQGVAVAGNYAYVADGDAGLQVIDVSNPARPVGAGGHDTHGFAQGLAVAGNYVYVADGRWGLQIFLVEGTAWPACEYADEYPFKTASPEAVDPWAFYYRECTSYVAWRINHELGVDSGPYPFHNHVRAEVPGALGRWSDAHNWDDRARVLGFSVNATPAAGAVAHWDKGELGSLGHVAYVEAVHADGSVDLTEYNVRSELSQHQSHAFNRRCRVMAANGVPRFIHLLEGLGAAGRPDLVVENVTFSPGAVRPGDPFTVAFEVKNVGPATAPATQARLRLTVDAQVTRADWPLAPLDVEIPAIPARQSHRFNGSVTVPASTPPGRYRVGAMADWDNRARQSDVRNDIGVSASQLEVMSSGVVGPMIVQDPQGATVTSGGHHELRVEATGAAPLAYRWYRDGGLCAGATGNTLSLRNIAVSQAGAYVAEVSNGGGSVRSQPADVIVLPRPDGPPPPPPAGRGVLTKLGAFNQAWPTVVITHGWQMFDTYNGAPPDWVTNMAQAVRTRLAAEEVDANVLIFTWPEAFTGDYLSLSDLAMDVLSGGLARLRQVTKFMLAFNQAMSFAFSEGNAIAGELQRELGSRHSAGLHLIGHSLGAIVNAAAVNVLPGLKGIHATILDAPLLLTPLNEGDFHQLLRPYPVVEWVDNYVGTKNLFPPAVGDFIPGAAHWFVDENHDGVHRFYTGTVTAHAWRESGFWYSKVLGAKGGYADRPWPQYWNPPPVTRGFWSFFGESLLSGEGVKIVAGEVAESAAESWGTWRKVFRLREAQPGSPGLASGGPAIAGGTARSSTILSVDLMIPEDSTAIEFDFRFDQRGDGDWLSATFNGETVFCFRGENFASDGFQTARIPASRFAGRVGVFELALHGTGEANSEVLVSNLRAFRQAMPRLSAVSRRDAAIEIAVSGEIGWTYNIEMSTNLVHWNVLTNLTLSQPAATFTEPIRPAPSASFYRAVEVP